MYKLDVDILKMYLHIKNELSRSRLSKIGALQTDRRTDTDVTENTPCCFCVQWRRQDLLRGGAMLEIRSWGTHSKLQCRVQQLLND